jgi:hypothetical protein
MLLSLAFDAVKSVVWIPPKSTAGSQRFAKSWRKLIWTV